MTSPYFRKLNFSDELHTRIFNICRKVNKFVLDKHPDADDSDYWGLTINKHAEIASYIDFEHHKNKNYGNQSDGEWLVFDELPDECELNIVEQNMTEPGELYVFDGWYYHQYFTGPNPRTTMLWADMVETEEQAFKFIEHMESL